ncbi:chaperonin 10-like protein [Cladorrhinum sp. PSN332]|nr:chaperonin 10-like protein [Cladorrhinum sp. PSN332]
MSALTFPIQTEALVVHSPGADFLMTPILVNELRPDEVLVEIQYAGLCHTDLLLQHGLLPSLPFPAIAGHEGAGTIIALGSPDITSRSSQLKPGAPVLLSFTSCGTCKPCTSNLPTKCPDMPRSNLRAIRPKDNTTAATLLSPSSNTTESVPVPVSAHFFGQSSFSRLAVVHERSIIPCQHPEQMHLYAPMGCGYQTGAGTIINVLKPGPSDAVLIFGMGSVGMAALMACKAINVQNVIAVDIVNGKLTLSKELGAGFTINPLELASVVDAVKDATGGKGAKFAIDTTGVGKVVESMLECLAAGGTAASIGAPPPGDKITVDAAAFFHMNKSWVSVIEGDSNPPEFIPYLIDLHRRGRFPVERISKVYPVAEIKRAIADMEAGIVIKPVLKF